MLSSQCCVGRLGNDGQRSLASNSAAFIVRAMTEEVLQQLRATATENPDDAAAQHALALALAGEGRAREAAEVFEVACQLRPNEAAWHFNRALAWQNVGEYSG